MSITLDINNEQTNNNIDDVKVVDNEQTNNNIDDVKVVDIDKKKCTKCNKMYDMTFFKNIKRSTITSTCTRCREITYKSYKTNNGFTKGMFTKTKQIQYLCNIIKTEINQVDLNKYDKLHKFGITTNTINIDIQI